MTQAAPATPETPVAPQAPETLEIQDLDQFVKLLVGWHTQQVKTLEHFLDMPEGVVMQVDGDEQIALTGDLLAGFKAGINMSLMQLGKLPFAMELESDAEPATPT